MEFFSTIYQLFLYQPIFNALILFSQILPGKDFGLAVISLTLAVRLVSYPLSLQAIIAQKKITEFQSKIKEVKAKFKNKDEQTRAMLELARKEKINPFASFLPLLIQFPILIVLYQIFSRGLHEEQLSVLYPFIPQPENLSPSFFGLIDLNAESVPLAILAGVLQFIQFKQTIPAKARLRQEKADFASAFQAQISYVFPVFLGWFASKLPAAFALYLVSTTVFSIGQYWFTLRKERPKKTSP